MPTTFFILAGEASGDSHAAKLITAIKALDPAARFVGMGGPKMAAAGLEVAKNLDGMQVIGFWEVIKNLSFFTGVGDLLFERVKQERPDALICIDYPGFNLRFAKKVKKLGIPVLYYIVPQVWAWKASRAKAMAEYVDRAYCVFEFEVPFFRKFGLKTEFVGHPLVDHDGSEAAVPKLELPPGPKTVAFLPGSRPAEVRNHAEPLRQGMNLFRKHHQQTRELWSQACSYKDFPADVNEIGVVEPGVDNRFSQMWLYARRSGTPEPLKWMNVFEEKHDPRTKYEAQRMDHANLLPSMADFSVVKSGTSTLEAGLAGNPMCVVYKGGKISYAIAHLLVNIPVFSLVNIVLGRYAVPELIQSEVNPERIAAEIQRGLTDERYRDQQRAALAELPGKLGGPGASARAAKGMLDFLKGRG